MSTLVRISNFFRKGHFLLVLAILGAVYLLMKNNDSKSDNGSSMFNPKVRTYFVSNDGNDINPGTKDHPKLTIQSALANANNGDTLKIGPGDFGGPINISKRVKIIGSANDSNATVICVPGLKDGSVINVNVSGSSKNHILFKDIKIKTTPRNRAFYLKDSVCYLDVENVAINDR